MKRIDPLVLGTLCALISALGYTAANIGLRRVAGDCDPVWVSCVKALPVTSVALLAVLASRWRGRNVLPGSHEVFRLILCALFMQFAGNVAFQWALGSIGLALTVPLSFGSVILGSALLGRIWLAEPVTPRLGVAMLVLIASISLLSSAADGSGSAAIQSGAAQAAVAAGVGAACLSGVAYATCNVVIRHTLGSGVSLSATLMILSMTGVVSLGLTSVGRLGLEGIAATAPSDFLVMLGAGTFNAIAFYSLAKSLELLPVVRANLLSASQVAMAAVAGVVLFGEAAGASLFAGILLTLFGLWLMKGGDARPGEEVKELAVAGAAPLAPDPTGRVAWSAAGDD